MSRLQYENVLFGMMRGDPASALRTFDVLRAKDGGQLANETFYQMWRVCNSPQNGDHRFGEHAFYEAKNTEKSALRLAIDSWVTACKFERSPEPVPQKPFLGRPCAICLEDMEVDQKIARCLWSCGNSIHADCQRLWNVKSRTNDCVFCKRDRTNFKCLLV